jgi:hypothetical protein
MLAVVVAAGVWLWTIFFPSPEKIIRRQLAEIASDVSFNSNESPLIGVAHAQKLAGFCVPNMTVKLDAPLNLQRTFESREEIAQLVLAVRSVLGGGLKVEFLDVNVTVASDKQTALADLTARVAALLAALLFAVSAICGYRSSKQIGGAEANFWRIALATFFLAIVGEHFWQRTLPGAAFPFLSSADFSASASATADIFRRCRASAAAAPFCSRNVSSRRSPF